MTPEREKDIREADAKAGSDRNLAPWYEATHRRELLALVDDLRAQLAERIGHEQQLATMQKLTDELRDIRHEINQYHPAVIAARAEGFRDGVEASVRTCGPRNTVMECVEAIRKLLPPGEKP